MIIKYAFTFLEIQEVYEFQGFFLLYSLNSAVTNVEI